jgi:acyl carrier protein
MTAVTPEDVRRFLTDYLKSRPTGEALPDSLPDDCDLLLSGVIDSLGLLQLMTALAERFDPEMDFEALDPEQMTIVSPLCNFVVEHAKVRSTT